MRFALLLALASLTAVRVQAQPIQPSEAYKEIAGQIAHAVESWCERELAGCMSELFSRKPGKLDYPDYPATGARDNYGAPIDGVYRLESVSGGNRDRWDTENRNTTILLVLNGRYFRAHVGATRADPSRYTAYGSQGKIGIENRPYTILQEKMLAKPGGQITFWKRETSHTDRLAFYRQPDLLEILGSPEDGKTYREVWEPITRESASNGWLNLLLGF
jgi:hypothetical protein